MASGPSKHGRQYRVEWRFDGRKQRHHRSDFDEALTAKLFIESLGGKIRDTDAVLTTGEFLTMEIAQPAVAAVRERRARARTFGSVAQEMIAAKVVGERISDRTEEIYARYLRLEMARHAERDVASFTQDDLHKERARLTKLTKADGTKRFGASTVSGYLGFMMGVLYFAYRNGMISTNPCAGFKYDRSPNRARARRFLERHEYETLLKAAGDDEQTRLMLRVMACTGMRISELLALVVDKCVLATAKPFIKVDYQWVSLSSGARRIEAPKMLSTGDITIPPDLAEELIAFIGQRGRVTEKLDDGTPADWVFTTPTYGRPWRDGNWRADVWNPLIKRAKELGFPADVNPTPHDLRHSHGSWLLNAGRPIEAVSKRLRHRSIVTTVKIYHHVSGNVEDQIIDDLRGL